jgi:DNA-binding NarL/FixJ family response regulator
MGVSASPTDSAETARQRVGSWREASAPDCVPGRTRRSEVLEVADLIRRRLANREIAQRLMISTRTVESHIEHIKAELGFGRRARIVAWALHRASDDDART